MFNNESQSRESESHMFNLFNPFNNDEYETIKIIKNGRKRKNETEIFVGIYHNKYYSDNILRKIQVHFISFIIKFLNL